MQSYGEDAESFSANFTVDTVSGTVISGTIEYSNGNPTDQFQVDISSDCFIEGALPIFVPTNLVAGDIVPGTEMGGITINETIQHLGRDAAHFTVTSEGESGDVYWDRQTGALLEMSGSLFSENGGFTIELASTNMWSTGSAGTPNVDWSLLAVIAGAIIVVAILAIGLSRQRRKPAKMAPSPQSKYPPPPPPPPPPTSIDRSLAASEQTQVFLSGR
jgi:hypothetical protein